MGVYYDSYGTNLPVLSLNGTGGDVFVIQGQSPKRKQPECYHPGCHS